jgi:hypothetical protein
LKFVQPTPFWTNTETGATFPRDIGDKLGLESDDMDKSDAFITAPHVLLGGGTYAKVGKDNNIVDLLIALSIYFILTIILRSCFPLCTRIYSACSYRYILWGGM